MTAKTWGMGWLLAAGLWLGLGGTAQAQDRLVFVDLNKVFEEFYKTKLADAQLKEQADQYKEERTQMVDAFKKDQEAFKALREESQDMTLSEDARNKRRSDAEEKLVQLREAEAKIRRFEESRRRQLDEQTKRVRTKLVDEIKETVANYAKEKGISTVLDVSGETLNGVATVVYQDGKSDITNLLIDLLNKGKS